VKNSLQCKIRRASAIFSFIEAHLEALLEALLAPLAGTIWYYDDSFNVVIDLRLSRKCRIVSLPNRRPD
jgi:hypothetical protein